LTSAERDRVGILLFDGVEVLDFCGPLEVLHTSGRFEIITVAHGEPSVCTAAGLRVIADCTTDECPPLDILIVPGGPGTRILESEETVLSWLRERFDGVGLFATVCTGSVLAAAAGLLHNRRATTHWGAIRELGRFPGVCTDWDSRIVDEGEIITSAGISAGIDMALYILESRYGHAPFQRALNAMEYDAYPSLKPNYHRPEFVRTSASQPDEGCDASQDR